MTLDGKVLGVLGETGKKLKQFGWIHEIACPSENELYVAELLNWRIQKLILHPQSNDETTEPADACFRRRERRVFSFLRGSHDRLRACRLSRRGEFAAAARRRVLRSSDTL
jgi:hypothetical protein